MQTIFIDINIIDIGNTYIVILFILFFSFLSINIEPIVLVAITNIKGINHIFSSLHKNIADILIPNPTKYFICLLISSFLEKNIPNENAIKYIINEIYIPSL